MTGMCPHCGEEVEVIDSLTEAHYSPGGPRDLRARERCPGSGQNPRCAESDRRPLWGGKPNRRFAG